MRIMIQLGVLNNDQSLAISDLFHPHFGVVSDTMAGGTPDIKSKPSLLIISQNLHLIIVLLLLIS
jgi:hypothetical protein